MQYWVCSGYKPWAQSHRILRLTIQFTFGGQNINLIGLASTQWMEESSCREMDKLENKGVVLQLLCEDELTWEQESSTPLKEVLEQFEDVFQKPKGLPPSRTHDHAINLLPGAKPISFRPYRYPFYQKEEIERIV